MILKSFKLSSVKLYVGEAIKSIFRNKLMSLSSVIIITACLLIVLVMYSLTANINWITSDVESNIPISAFVCDSVDEGDSLIAILHAISAHEHVSQVEYLSREDNLAVWIEREGFDPVALGLDDGVADFLRRRFDVYVEHSPNVRGVAEWLESPQMEGMGIANVNHPADVVEDLVEFNRALRTTSFIVIAVLTLLSIVITATNVRLTIHSRRNEIGIMKFIGSTDWFIRWPFVLEGLFLGMVGAAAAAAMVVIFYDQMTGIIGDTFLFGAGNLTLLPGTRLFPQIIPMSLLLGGAIGTVSSVVSIRRYLNV